MFGRTVRAISSAVNEASGSVSTGGVSGTIVG
ncbi:hypothetical protein DE4587_02454 [Mycobacteroides salmoniphilum]|nr:hypothetical protein DE4586_02074 [Mycobacteroides salmoniphilum]TDZ86488.1 hypothetical protein DE4587_02454 [Mycobacteroides salmoniphilum]